VYAVTPQGEVVAKAPRTPDVPMEVQPNVTEVPADGPAPPTEEQAPSPLREAPPAENTESE
ncbi:MAG: hypothetical protein EOO70_10330, partial [Myxococcaceae bacterium]